MLSRVYDDYLAKVHAKVEPILTNALNHLIALDETQVAGTVLVLPIDVDGETYKVSIATESNVKINKLGEVNTLKPKYFAELHIHLSDHLVVAKMESDKADYLLKLNGVGMVTTLDTLCGVLNTLGTMVTDAAMPAQLYTIPQYASDVSNALTPPWRATE